MQFEDVSQFKMSGRTHTSPQNGPKVNKINSVFGSSSSTHKVGNVIKQPAKCGMSCVTLNIDTRQTVDQVNVKIHPLNFHLFVMPCDQHVHAANSGVHAWLPLFTTCCWFSFM